MNGTSPEREDSSIQQGTDDFGLLYAAFKERYVGLVTLQYRVATGLALAIGWVITTKQAQKFLGSSDVVACASLSLALGVGPAFIAFATFVYRSSERLYRELIARRYVEPAILEHQRIPKALLLGCCIVQVLMSAVLAVFLFTIWSQQSAAGGTHS